MLSRDERPGFCYTGAFVLPVMTAVTITQANAPSTTSLLAPIGGELIRGLHSLAPRHQGSVVTIGAFDGVHLGHRAILGQVVAKAKQLGLPSVAMVFEPQPNEYFCGDKAPARLMPLREKLTALFAAGIDRVLCLRFDAKFAELTADDFVQTVLLSGLGVKHLVVGDDFRFGCDRRGDFKSLRAWGKRADFTVADSKTLIISGDRASSTRIRKALAASDFALAEEQLGQPYGISGRVIYGQQVGRTIGVPTANVLLKRYRSPLSGVFAVTIQLPSGENLRGVANVGVRPTVDGDSKPLLEVHIFDFDGDIYGSCIRVCFCTKLRDEQKFSSIDVLKQQIERDISDARTYFNT